MSYKYERILNRILRNNAPFLILLLMVACSSNDNKSHYKGPLTPEESMNTFYFSEDFKAEIFAAEPLVMDPVSMEFDEEGNAYVVEMLDVFVPDSMKGKGRIVMLKDLDGDGRADTAIVFADSIRDATSILPWEGGLLIAAAPNIMYYKDTDGDGRADVKEILFAGFFTKNEEAQITNLRFSVDNWIYANNAGQEGEITFNRKPDAPKLLMRGADFRFRLDRNQFEVTTGPGQFGLFIDDWGHRFFTQNTLHIQQAVIPNRYLQRNPFLPSNAKTAIADISDHDLSMYQLTETPYWRQVRTDRRNKEFQEHQLDRIEYARDHFTGASGGTFYGGDAFGKEYYGNAFTGDVAGNLVHRDILTPGDSVPYRIAKRGNKEKDKEFLSSTDSWFRPVGFTSGPDGYLYVIDIYRQHIEGPTFIPVDLKEDMDFNAGDDYGRIYRIMPENVGAYKKVLPGLRDMKSGDLVAVLSHQNQWWRLQAQRLLLERRDKTVIPAIKALFVQSGDPRFRLHALYVLEGLDALDAKIVTVAMKDPSPEIRENAVILSEQFPACLPLLKDMITDSSIRVAFQTTLSLGEFENKSVIPSLVEVITRYGYSPWFRTAVLSSEAGTSIDFLKATEREGFFDELTPWKLTFFESFSNVIGGRNREIEVENLLESISQPYAAGRSDWQLAGIKGLIQGLRNLEKSDSSLTEKLKSIEVKSGSDVGMAIKDLKQLYADSLKGKSFQK